MKKIAVVIIVFQSLFCFGQNHSNALQTGIYTGGICIDNSICGDWIVMPDSNFAFISFKDSMIQKIGFGKVVNFTDSSLSFQFSKSHDPTLLNLYEIKYFSKTISPYDSIFIGGKLCTDDGKPLSFATIVYGNKFSTISDEKGLFAIKLSNEEDINSIEIVKIDGGYIPLKIVLQAGNNFHDLTIKFPAKDLITTSEFISESKRFTFKINKNSSDRIGNDSFVYTSKSTMNLINKLQRTKKLQPLITTAIDFFIQFIQ